MCIAIFYVAIPLIIKTIQTTNYVFPQFLLQKGNLQMFITVHGLADEKKKVHFMLVEWRLNRVHRLNDKLHFL